MWDKAKDYAIKCGEIAVAGAQKAGLVAKLKTEIVMHDRRIRARQKRFGVQLYDHIEPLSANEGFWNAEDDLTMVIRPHLLSTQREISVLKIRKANFEEQITIENLKHSTRFPAKQNGEEVVTFKENVVNAGKQVAHTSLISKYKTDLVVIDNLMKDHKQTFGKTMFAIFVAKEDFEHWLPTERMIRSMYDAARRDVLDVEKEKQTKIEDLRALGGVYKENEQNNNTEQQQASKNSIYDAPSNNNNSGTPQVFMSDTSTRSTTSSRMQMQTHQQQQQPYMDQSSNDMNQNHNNMHQNDLFDPFGNNSQTTTVKTTFI